jgi:hypothetical protein
MKNYPITWLQEVEVPRISRQALHEGDKVASPMCRPSLPPGEFHESAGRIRLTKNGDDLIGN